MANIRRVNLFLGMIVGVGFATGKEIALYFGGKSLTTVVMGGILMGLAYATFLTIGSSGSYQYLKNTRSGKVVAHVMSISVLMSYVAMIAGAEQLLAEVFHVRSLGLITGIVVSMCATRSMRCITSISNILVPIIVIIVLSLARGRVEICGDFSPLAPITYVGMNMLMGGYLVLEEGDRVSRRDIVLCGLLVAIIFVAMLILLVSNIESYIFTSMPILALLESQGRGYMGAVLIYIAILTTALGQAKLIYNNLRPLCVYRWLTVLFLILVSIISSSLDFGTVISYVYGILGIVGAIFVLYVTIGYVYFARSHREE